MEGLGTVAPVDTAGLKGQVLSVHLGQGEDLRLVVERHDGDGGVGAGAFPGLAERRRAARHLHDDVGTAVLAVAEDEVAAGVGSGQEHVGPVRADKGGSDGVGLADDEASRAVQAGAEQGAESGGACAEDEHGVVGRDTGDARGPVACGEDVADEQGGLVAHRVGDGREPLVGVGHADVFGLPAVDAATERPSAVGVGAVVHIAVAAEEALAAERLDIDRHALARADGTDSGTHLFDDADHLVPHGDAGHSAGHAAVLDVQVAGADAAERDAHDGVARVDEGGARFFEQFETFRPDVGVG